MPDVIPAVSRWMETVGSYVSQHLIDVLEDHPVALEFPFASHGSRQSWKFLSWVEKRLLGFDPAYFGPARANHQSLRP
jgi:hypothetical protein